MELFQILSIITCVTSTITAIVVCIALLPHVKDGMAIIRDAVLWLALIGLFVTAGWLGFDRIRNKQSDSSVTVPASQVNQTRPDAFYAGR